MILKQIANLKQSLKDNWLILNLQQRFRGEKHKMSTEEVNKIALKVNDDKIKQ